MFNVTKRYSNARVMPSATLITGAFGPIEIGMYKDFDITIRNCSVITMAYTVQVSPVKLGSYTNVTACSVGDSSVMRHSIVDNNNQWLIINVCATGTVGSKASVIISSVER